MVQIFCLGMHWQWRDHKRQKPNLDYTVASIEQEVWHSAEILVQRGDSEGDIVQRTISSDPQPNGQHTADEKS